MNPFSLVPLPWQQHRKRVWLVIPFLLAMLWFLTTPSAYACGGLFCQNSPVDQAAERIVFVDNGDGTITTLVEIEYTGSAPDFSWILPIPEAISAEDLAVPEEGEEIFTELHNLTDVQIIRPPDPDCGIDMMMSVAVEESAEEEVTVFASGEVGPFGFDVIGSENPDALIDWLRQNNYRVDPPMVPLINMYVEEQFAFIAMRLLDGETADSIKPIQITYPAEKPMIPLRLTAVAADPNMGIFVWIFSDEQAVPENFEHMEIANGEITLFSFGGNNYQALINRRADALGGRAFITEFAGDASQISFQSEFLREVSSRRPYLTRLTTTIDPEEMTVDPVFTFDPQARDVSNVRDMSQMTGVYDCERDLAEEAVFSLSSSDAIDPFSESGQISVAPPENVAEDGGAPASNVGAFAAGAAAALLAVGGYALTRRSRKSDSS